MAFYKECPLCGCTLDPGEKCDCQEEKEQEQQRIMGMFRVGGNGQMNFSFAGEGRDYEKKVV